MSTTNMKSSQVKVREAGGVRSAKDDYGQWILVLDNGPTVAIQINDKSAHLNAAELRHLAYTLSRAAYKLEKRSQLLASQAEDLKAQTAKLTAVKK